MTSVSASRVTRSSRSLRLAVVLFAGVLAGVTVLRAQETPPAAPPAAPSTAPSGEPASRAGTAIEVPAVEPVADDAAADGTAPGGKPAPATTPATAPPGPARPVGPTPGRFEPTEKVRADFDVSFPIDI